MKWLRLRSSEWLLIGFFAYIALLIPFFPDRPSLKFQPVLILCAVFALCCTLSGAHTRQVSGAIQFLRDWLPIGILFGAFREMELFLPRRFDHSYETIWLRWDHVLLFNWYWRQRIESLGRIIPLYLELCYLLVYGLAAYCVAVLYFHRRAAIDRFYLIYLTGTLAAYALFPYFPSQPPRFVAPSLDMPTVTSWVRTLNLFLLKKATIHVGVFPSAHVSSAFSSAWAMFTILPGRKRFGWGLLIYAVSVSVATIYGRYHYAADVVAGFALSLLAGLLAVVLSRRPHSSV
ncbi:MAG: phosphatase PAP2 family protein [Acidobacteriaceae bacterium]|nr:phosphatase PAP2 family protein [Acidobacteriaceae bacterium]MBV9497859.1 phosphatase PAP2 family protein [Acidobacteriaceae bacterium]